MFPVPMDAFLLLLAGVSLAFAVRFPRPGIGAFLVLAAALIVEDQNRFQPWFYLYWVLLFYQLLPARAALAGSRVAISAVYLWAGIQKCNPTFMNEVVPFFAEPIEMFFPKAISPAIRWIIAAAPAFEILVGIGLWVPWLRRSAILATFAIHLLSLCALGPWGNDFNRVVWPWNITMPLLVLALFSSAPGADSWRALIGSPVTFGFTALFCLLPILSFKGWLDSYPSFCLYCGKTARATILLTPRTVELLPERIKPFAKPDPAAPPGMRSPLYVLDFRNWAEKEMGAPPLPEVRSYRSIAKYLTQWSATPGDIRLVLQPRSQPARVERPMPSN